MENLVLEQGQAVSRIEVVCDPELLAEKIGKRTFFFDDQSSTAGGLIRYQVAELIVSRTEGLGSGVVYCHHSADQPYLYLRSSDIGLRTDTN